MESWRAWEGQETDWLSREGFGQGEVPGHFKPIWLSSESSEFPQNAFPWTLFPCLLAGPHTREGTLTPGRSCPCSVDSEGGSRLLEEDSEVYKMLQENREGRVAPRQSSSFRLLQEALEAEERGEPLGGLGAGRRFLQDTPGP